MILKLPQIGLLLSILMLSACGGSQDNQSTAKKEVTLLNVSYDPTRELYQQYNQLFEQYYFKKTGQKVHIKQSHGGSGKQALSVIDGLQADVVTLALAADINALNQHKQLLKANWQSTLPDNSTPYTSTIVFLVRKGNPKNIHDWDDLIHPGIQVITPNPKTSGGARWNFLAAWAYAKHAHHGDETAARDFVTKLYKNTPVLDTGARGSTISFTKRQLGDVLLAWENEAHLILKEDGGKNYEIITPSISILCEPPVAIVDKVVDKRGTRDVAKAYLEYLYSDDAQRLIAKNFYRPRNPQIAKEFSDSFAKVKLITLAEEFGNWDKVQKYFFADGSVFDQIYQ